MSAVFHVTDSTPKNQSNLPDCLEITEKTGVLSSKRRESGRFLSDRLPIQPVCDRIIRDFLRGIGLRSLGATYRCNDKVMQDVLRVRLREFDASQRRQNVVAMPSPMRRAA